MKRNTTLLTLLCVMVVFAGCSGIGANEAEEEFNKEPNESEDFPKAQDETRDDDDESDNTSSSSDTNIESTDSLNDSEATGTEPGNEEPTTKSDTPPEKDSSTENSGDGTELVMADEIHTLTVYVAETSGVDDVSITLTHHSDQITTQKTADDGIIEFGVASGDYTISSTDPNGGTTTATVTINGEDREIILK